ncbi:trypsin-like serine protease [Streptomyces sp. NPDC059355]|uniref:trypsin-like serine protease n=1 Tax=Streptomyces sp. NPDC059355 TaxID=3346811 RepID=UPI0036BBA200
MFSSRPRHSWIAAALAAAVGAGLLTSTGALAATGTPDASDRFAHTAQITTGAEADARGCSGTLVAAQWLLTSKSCFAATPGEAVPAGKPARAAKATLGSTTYDIVDLIPRTDRDVVLARLDKPVAGVTPAKIASAPAAAGSALTAAGFGRTKTAWVPGKVHTAAFTTTSAAATTLALEGGQSGDAICQGDAGGPVVNAQGDVVALGTRSWLAGCFGTPATETRRAAEAARVDGLAAWVMDVRAAAPGWRSQAAVQTDKGLYQGARLADGGWTGFVDVQSKAGDIGGVRASAIAGIDDNSHVVALGNDGKLRHTIRKADGTWGAFGDIGSMAGVLTGITHVSAVSIGTDLHVVVAADGKVFHTVRRGDGSWTPFGDISMAAGPIGGVSSVATASVGGELQVIAVSGGKAFHTIRNTTGHWSEWGAVAWAAGTTGPVTSVSMAGIGGDAHIVIATDNGTRQYHTIRKADRNWDPFGELKGPLGTITARSVAAASVDGELQLTAVTSDGKVVHTIRHADRTWANPTAAALGTIGKPAAISMTGTL